MENRAQKDGIAIIGIGCRFPGGINDTEAFWNLLVEGREAVCEVPADRWNVERYYDAEPGIAGKSIAKRGGFIEGLDQFDPQFFGISPREAPYVDPQQRLLLETAWEAMEDAGIILDLEKGTDIGVFVGVSHNDYQVIQGTPWDSAGISPHSPTGSAHSIAANRISYCFNLLGPSVAMDTACSSALTAVHCACEHIWTGRGKVAMAGGVTIMVTPGGFIGFSQAGMLSPDGHCKAFAASANGFVRGEGAGMVLLKKLSDAIADGDPIHGVILGTALNQDGHTNGISLPSPDAQARLVRDACKDAGVHPTDIGFVEAHGTGTAVGDPIEATALSEALCPDRPADQPLAIGSSKTNLGHLETAAGMPGLVKALLILKHGQIPPSLHFDEPSPYIDFDALKLRVPTKVEPFPKSKGPRMVGINSFGFGGANAHVIVSEPPQVAKNETKVVTKDRSWPVMLSARSEEALKATAWKLTEYLEEKQSANGRSPTMPDLVYTLGTKRNHHQHRLTVVADSPTSLLQELNDFAIGQSTQKVRTSFTPRREKPARVGFVMSGQGPQWWGMGRKLMEHEPIFRQIMERCDAAMKPYASFSLLEELAKDEATSQVSRTEVGQPAIFAMQVALAELWKSWGVKPDAIVGHSVGEIAAACVAGVMSLEEGARIIVLRAKFMENCAKGDGTMLAVALDEAGARAVIARHDRTVSIAAFNGPKSLTLSGAKISLEAIQAELEPQGIFARFVRVDHPFHHAMMQPAADNLNRELASLTPQDETVPFFSTVTGDRCHGKDMVAEHWGRGVRQAVLFAPAVNAMADFGVDVWLELSAHPALVVSMQEILGARGSSTKAPIFTSARREREHDYFLETAMDLHMAGVELNFAAMTPSRRQLTLPLYAWDKARWWNESPDWKEGRLAPGGKGLLDVRLPRSLPTWIARFDARHMAFLKDHKVESHIIFPAAGYVDMVLEAGVQIFEGRPFVIEDFEIRKPLILPDPASGVIVELTYDPGERLFTLQSKFEQGAAWSVHVVGSMRGERTETEFAHSTWSGLDQPELIPFPIDEFYEHMSDLGLKYGEEFRGVRELAAGGGKGAGIVSLTEASAARAAEYPLHPVLLDGALHVFSAGAKSVEDRKARMKLPVRFGRILYLKSPGATTKVQSKVQQFNDEFIEGDVGLYDSEGKPCVLVHGFRAISMAAARRSGAPGGTRDLIYHLAWEKTASPVQPEPLAPVPLTVLQETMKRITEEVIEVRGRAKLQGAMAAQDALALVMVAKGFQSMGVGRGRFDAKTLRIAESMLRPYQRLIDALLQHELIAPEPKGGYKPTPKFSKAAGSAQKVLGAFLAHHAGHLPEATLCSSTSAELGPILRGEKDAVQVIFGGANTDLLEQFYGDGLFASPWIAALSGTVAEAARRLPEGRGLRILEVGAGTGGLASALLPQLQRGLHQYVFTDVSASLFTISGQKLSGFPEVEFKVFDLDKPVEDQNIELGSFDFVLGTNVIHAVADVTASLTRIEQLLAPGGTLMFMDIATPNLWTDSIFGLTSGWWHLTDRELRPEYPLLQRAQWETVMKKAGFAEVSSLSGLNGLHGEGQIGLFARKAWETPKPTSDTTTASAPAESSWLIFADEGGLGAKIADLIEPSGARVRIVKQGKAFAQSGDAFTLNPNTSADFLKLIETAVADAQPDRLLYLWTLDDATVGTDALLGTDPLLHLTHALENTCAAAKLRFDLVTRGAQAVGERQDAVAVAQAPAIGMFRVILSEHPNFSGGGIDLPLVPSDADAGTLWAELLSDSPEREVAFRGEARYAQRIDRGLPMHQTWLSPEVGLRLESRERGLLDTLHFTPCELPAPAPGEVLIEVRAAGMNFRDVLKALALYPAETPDARIFGDEVGGIVKAVGEGITHVAPGDHVFGLAVFGMATRTLARGGDVRKIPGKLSFEEAATLPVVFMTAWHALKNVARMRKGETILVHAGAGGVGMAAIQIAKYLGVDVIASAGSPSKRALLMTMGVKHVVDSRRGDFTDAVLNLTNNRGVDVVLNALAAEAIPMGLACLAEYGRFLEIGKRDIYQNSRIPLWPMRKNGSFHVIAMDAVFAGDESLTRELLSDLAKLVEKGALDSLPYRAFPASRVDAAFRLMAQGKHIGKVVVTFSDSFIARRGEPPVKPFTIKPDASYLITGAFGGFGRVLGRWLADCGAKHLVLTGRSGASSPEAVAFVEEMHTRGLTTEIVKADVGTAADVQRMVEAAEPTGFPLKGVFHLAMVIDDAPISALNSERMLAVMKPKAYGGWLLHEATKGLDMDAFVMFSSVSSIFGNPAQANYSAANTFLDALAHERHRLGLPGLTINWGVLGGEGYVARNERVAEFLARQGTAALTPGEVMSLMESFLVAGADQVAAIRVDWNKWRQSFRGMSENPLLERVFASTVESQDGHGAASDWRPRIEAASAAEKEGVICQAVREVVAGVLRLKPDSLRDDQPLTDLGLDSLMGVEIENSIESAIGVALPPTSLMRARTIGQIAVLINEHMGNTTTTGAAKPGAKAAAPAVVEAPAASAEEVDLDALSDEEIERLLAEQGADAATEEAATEARS